MRSSLFNSIFLPSYLSLFHISFIVLMGIFGRYKFENGEQEVPGMYAMFMDVHSMMFVGFGFLMTFLKRYGYSSVGFNFIVAAYVLEWSLLVRGWLESALTGTDGVFEINILSLLVADFCAAAVLISFGAVIGKATLIQLLIMTTIEVVIQSVNEFIGVNYLKCYDVGESIYVHIFGAYFGLTVAKFIQFKRNVESEKEGSNYNSDLFSMIGTLFLFLYWPSFNSATAKDEGQIRAIVNTYMSITASVLTTFIVSVFVGRGKFNMVHVQNATLAGGVAVGAVADMAINPFGAMIIGSFAGIISTLGFQFLTPLLNRTFLHDTCGVNNLHGMPGLISGISSAIVAATATREGFGGNRLYTYYPARTPVLNSPDYISQGLEGTEYSSGGLGRTAVEQGGYQMAGIALTLGMAIFGGAITGLILRLPFIEQLSDGEELFEDEPCWKLPEEPKSIELVESKKELTI